MLIGALQKFSLLDYPGRVSAIVFTQGCNFRCRFCYNPMLVWPAAQASPEAESARGSKLKYASGFNREQQKAHPLINEDDFFVFLKSRSGKLDAVVITGGEPTEQKDLAKFLKKIKALGFLVKLDTNGTHPEVISGLLKEKLVDYLAMDLKAPPEKYAAITATAVDLNKIKKSVKLIRSSGLPHEFRTTVVPELLGREEIEAMGELIRGADLWYLQNFKSQTDLVDPKLKGLVPYNLRQMKELAALGAKYVKQCAVR